MGLKGLIFCGLGTGAKSVSVIGDFSFWVERRHEASGTVQDT
jgi:hypothetical protein